MTYLTDRAHFDKPQTKAAVEIDRNSYHAMLHAIITAAGGEVKLDRELFAKALLYNLKIAVDEAEGKLLLIAEGER